ncbi:hypothetical protein ACFQPG_03810 [Sphingomonas sp. GCM10030256]|uniref:hypothetical protein n=1 Tax=Sphingomonas sp. GCM10030256 TaxID=3273427 RepID=UPI00360CAC43
MRKSIVLAAVFLMVPAAASAQSMNAEAFHKRATALTKKGAMAVFSPGEIKALMSEGKAAGQRSRELRLAAVKSGSRPRYCPPEGPQSMTSTEFMKHLSAIPQAERQKIDMTEATTRVLAVKFPCKG